MRLRRRRAAPLRVEAPPALLEWRRKGTAPLEPRPASARPSGASGGAPSAVPTGASGGAPSAAPTGPLRVALVVPWFFEGSGGHSTIANLARGLGARGHDVSVWLEEGSASDFEAFFGPAGKVVEGFGAWDGADVVVATGWQTVHRTLLLPGVAARAYLVQDHEPEFYGTSAERTWAEQTYALGLHCVCASRWLAALVSDRYGASATSFELGVRHDVYHPRDVARRDDLVLFYARAVTPRRAVPLGLLALEELARRRPQVDVALFGEPRPLATRFQQLGVLPPDELARLYGEAAAGVVLSLTNPSLVPTEMLACGLPVVDVRSDAMLSTFGADGPVRLADLDPLAIADAIEAALDAPRSGDGVEWVRQRTWENAAAQVEAGLRAAFS